MKNLIADIKNGQYRPVYLLFGEEEYLIRFYGRRLAEKNVLPEDRFMNLAVFTEEEATVDKVIQSLDTYPMLGEKRVTVVRDSGWFGTKKPDEAGAGRLARALGQILPTSLLIFEESQVDKRTSLYKTVSKCGYAAELNRPGEDDLIRFVARELASHQKKIDEATARYFLDYVGGDMMYMKLELEKAASYAAGRPFLGRSDIEAVCTVQPETDIFKLTDALGSRARRDALRIYERLIANNEAPQRIFYMLCLQIRKIYRVKIAESARLSKEECARIGLVSPRALWAYSRQASRFQTRKLEELIERMTDLDEKIKTGLVDASDAVLSVIEEA